MTQELYKQLLAFEKNPTADEFKQAGLIGYKYTYCGEHIDKWKIRKDKTIWYRDISKSRPIWRKVYGKLNDKGLIEFMDLIKVDLYYSSFIFEKNMKANG